LRWKGFKECRKELDAEDWERRKQDRGLLFLMGEKRWNTDIGKSSQSI